jgi:Flp pilus assembly protein TadG
MLRPHHRCCPEVPIESREQAERWQTLRSLKLILSDRSGSSGVEFALIAAIMLFLLLNLIDVARYIHTRMEVRIASQMGAQAAVTACDIDKVPATTLCPGLIPAVTAAVQSTTLGSNISLASNSPSEGYYCINSANDLEYVAAVSKKPDDCSKAGTPKLQPSDYLIVDVTYQYETLFADLTVARLFSSPITSNARIRLK